MATATCTKYLVKFDRVVFELYEWTDRHTHHNALHPSWGAVNITAHLLWASELIVMLFSGLLLLLLLQPFYGSLDLSRTT